MWRQAKSRKLGPCLGGLLGVRSRRLQRLIKLCLFAGQTPGLAAGRPPTEGPRPAVCEFIEFGVGEVHDPIIGQAAIGRTAGLLAAPALHLHLGGGA